MSLDPSRSFFHVNTTEAWLLTAAALLIGLGIGWLVAHWGNRLCEPPPRRAEAKVTAMLTAGLFALATFMIVFLEAQRIDEVTPDVAWRYGRLIAHLGLLTLLIAATATDLREYIIPDQITIPGIARGISSFVLGEEAMGFGDVTLMAMIGSFLGWQPMLFVFLLAPFCGLIVGVIAKSLLNRPYIPYGPYLSAAAMVVMLSWRWIWSWEPTPRVSIRKLFGDLPSLAILAGTSLVLLLVLLSIVRWWRGGPRESELSETSATK